MAIQLQPQREKAFQDFAFKCLVVNSVVALVLFVGGGFLLLWLVNAGQAALAERIFIALIAGTSVGVGAYQKGKADGRKEQKETATGES